VLVKFKEPRKGVCHALQDSSLPRRRLRIDKESIKMVLVDMEKVSISFKKRFLEQEPVQEGLEEPLKVDGHESVLTLLYSRRDGYPEECPQQKARGVFTPNFWGIHNTLPDTVLSTLACIVESGNFDRSKVDLDQGGRASGDQTAEKDRSSSSLLIEKPAPTDPRPLARALHHIEKLAASLFGVSTECVEPLQVVRYTGGQSYTYHHDAISTPGFLVVEKEEGGKKWLEWVDADTGKQFPTEFPDPASGRRGRKSLNGTTSSKESTGPPIRIGTLLIYLNTLPYEWGAETDLTWATTRDVKAGKLVNPVRNCAVAWSNIDTQGRPAEGAIHQGRGLSANAPKGALKYAVNVWVCDRGVGDRSDSSKRRMADISEIEATRASSLDKPLTVACAQCFPWSLQCRGLGGELEEGEGQEESTEGKQAGECLEGLEEVCLMCGSSQPGEEGKNELVLCETDNCLAGVHLECYYPFLRSSHLLTTDYATLSAEGYVGPKMGRPLDVLCWRCPLCEPNNQGGFEGVELLPEKIRKEVFGDPKPKGPRAGEACASKRVTSASSSSSLSGPSSSAQEEGEGVPPVSSGAANAKGKKRISLPAAGGQKEGGESAGKKNKNVHTRT